MKFWTQALLSLGSTLKHVQLFKRRGYWALFEMMCLLKLVVEEESLSKGSDVKTSCDCARLKWNSTPLRRVLNQRCRNIKCSCSIYGDHCSWTVRTLVHLHLKARLVLYSCMHKMADFEIFFECNETESRIHNYPQIAVSSNLKRLFILNKLLMVSSLSWTINLTFISCILKQYFKKWFFNFNILFSKGSWYN